MSQAGVAPAKGEWARSWPVVVACALGISVSAVAPYAMGQFMASLEHAFGWSRAQSASGLSVGVAFGALMSMLSLGGGIGPLLAGFVHDQFGAYTVVSWGGAAVALVSAVALFTLPSAPAAEQQPA